MATRPIRRTVKLSTTSTGRNPLLKRPPWVRVHWIGPAVRPTTPLRFPAARRPVPPALPRR